MNFGNYHLTIQYAFSAFIDPYTKKVTLDMDDDSGSIRDENYDEVDDDHLYFKVVDDIRKKLHDGILKNLEEYLKKNRKYKKYFK